MEIWYGVPLSPMDQAHEPVYSSSRNPLKVMTGTLGREISTYLELKSGHPRVQCHEFAARFPQSGHELEGEGPVNQPPRPKPSPPPWGDAVLSGLLSAGTGRLLISRDAATAVPSVGVASVHVIIGLEARGVKKRGQLLCAWGAGLFGARPSG